MTLQTCLYAGDISGNGNAHFEELILVNMLLIERNKQTKVKICNSVIEIHAYMKDHFKNH